MYSSLVSPPHDKIDFAQQSFKSILMGLSHPGKIQTTPSGFKLPSLSAATSAVLFAVLDSDVHLYITPSLNNAALRENLVFHFGCQITTDPTVSDFALMDMSSIIELDHFQIGSERCPHQSCTLIVQLEKLMEGSTCRWEGPGISDFELVTLPLDASFWQVRHQHTIFPQGLDFVFVSETQLVGLPRSTRTQLINEEKLCMLP